MKTNGWITVAAMIMITAHVHVHGQVIQSWTPVDGLYGGSVQSLLELNESTMFAGALYGGLYRSTDEGTNWSFEGLSGMAVYDMLRLSNGYVLAAVSQGVMLSRDDAKHWEHIAQVFDGFVLTLAETSAGIVYAGGRLGLFRSTDHGVTWSSVDIGAEGAQVLALCSGTDDEVFAGTNNAGLRFSSDGMTNWVLADQSFDGKRIRGIARRERTIVTNIWADDIYLSTDNGASWQARSGVIDRPRVNDFIFRNNGDIVAGLYTGDIWRTADQGMNWEQLYQSGQGGVICLLAGDVGTLYAGVEGPGVIRSDDDGQTWSESGEGLCNFRIPDILMEENGTLHVSAYYWPWLKSTDGGRNWIEVDDVGYTAKLLAIGKTGILYSAREYAGVFFSTDGGTSWTRRHKGLDRPRFRALGVAPDGHLFAVLSDRPHFHLPPGTEEWQEVRGPLETLRINCFLTAYGNIYAGVEEEGMFRSTDNGATWTQCINGLTVSTIKCLAAGPRGLMAGTLDGAYLSTDRGDSWTRFGNMIEAVVTSVACAPGGDVYLSTSSAGVLQYEEATNDWIGFREGLPDNNVNEVVVDSQGRLFASINWHGLFRCDTEVSGMEGPTAVSSELILHKNYPNPCSPSTTIRFDLSQSMTVILRITDVLGYEVSRPYDGEVFAAGTHIIAWDAAGLPPGIYCCILEAGGMWASRRMVVVR